MSRFAKIVLTVGAVITASVVGLFFLGQFDFINIDINGVRREVRYQKLWEESNYQELVRFAEETLAEHPLDGNSLFYAGLGHFYISNASVEIQEQQRHLQEAIINLRQVLILEHAPQRDIVNYTLGRAYFHKGQFYYELAIEYILAAIDAGFVDPQAYQYLGGAYAKIGDNEKSIRYLESALESFSTPDLKMALAELYILNQRYGDANNIINELYTQIAADDSDARTVQRVTLLKINLEIESGRYDVAKSLLEDFVDQYPNNAEGYYLFGVLYERDQQPEQARYQWRTAVRVNPHHSASLVKLQSEVGGN